MTQLAITAKTRMPTPAPDLEALVRRHQTGVWRYLRCLGADLQLAEDLLQDTFLVAFRRLEQDRGDAAVATFLRTTARHLYLRRRRDEGRREELLVELAEQLWQRDCAGDDGEQWLQALQQCVQSLEGRPQQAVTWFYGEGRDRASVAAAMGMKENGLKTLLQRVRATLQRVHRATSRRCAMSGERDRDEVFERRLDWGLREMAGGERVPDVTARVLARHAA
ncbi:MAG: sigma-70 family RNA polymerase sigma factor, partial [Planctomycetota bacterium]